MLEVITHDSTKDLRRQLTDPVTAFDGMQGYNDKFHTSFIFALKKVRIP